MDTTKTNAEVRARLRLTAIKGLGDSAHFGQGRVDALRSVTVVASVSTPCDSVLTGGVACTFTATANSTSEAASYTWRRQFGTHEWETVQTGSDSTFVDTLSRVFHTDSTPFRVEVTLADQDWGFVDKDTAAVVLYAPWTPLWAEIYGPETIPLNEECTWVASVAYGVVPYAYRWYRDGDSVGAGDTYIYTASRVKPFRLELLVFDAYPDSVRDTLEVTVVQQGGQCLARRPGR
jgi:hypothetical protein